MKYIRTKDGKIYDSLALRVDEIVYKDEQGKWCREYRTVDPLKKALKIADTIEELCDEFVIRYKDGTHDTLNYDYSQRLKYMEMEQYNMKLRYGDCDLFGAIWCEWGLKYVARMNSDGVLELL